jgi:hypothetical protein
MDNYPALLKEVKDRIRQAQIKATMSANAKMILMYWDVWHIVATRQATEGWGALIIPRLSKDIRNDLPKIKGFSERNMDRILAFYRECSELPISPTRWRNYRIPLLSPKSWNYCSDCPGRTT